MKFTTKVKFPVGRIERSSRMDSEGKWKRKDLSERGRYLHRSHNAEAKVNRWENALGFLEGRMSIVGARSLNGFVPENEIRLSRL